MPAPTPQARVLRKNLSKISEGLLSTATDAVLFTLFLPFASLGTRPNSYGVYQTFQEANKLLAKINYKTFKNALYRLKKNGLIKPFAKGLLELEISRAGQERLASLVPQYQEKRPWTKMVYLINYDIKIANNRKRDLLRHFLERLGAAKLQQSLYLTPYNPKKLLAEFVKQENTQGQVLVSELGKDSSIGDYDLKELISKVYRLAELNERYRVFLEKYKNVKEVKSRSQLSLEFYSILKDDPQLPFELLPKDFLSDEAYLLFQKLTS